MSYDRFMRKEKEFSVCSFSVASEIKYIYILEGTFSLFCFTLIVFRTNKAYG